jgi:hypothetical protein
VPGSCVPAPPINICCVKSQSLPNAMIMIDRIVPRSHFCLQAFKRCKPYAEQPNKRWKVVSELSAPYALSPAEQPPRSKRW